MTLRTKLAKKEKSMWGMSLDAWNSLLLWCLVFAAIAAATVAVSTYATIQLAKEEAAVSKAELDKYKLTVEGKVADAKSEGISAGRVAGDAVVRAAELEKEAALAKLQTEQIKQVVAWRVIHNDSILELRKVLSARPGSVNLRYTSGDPEALFLAVQISKVLIDAKWQVAPGAENANALVFGISLPDTSGEDLTVLREAFSAAKVPFSTQSLPQTGSSVVFNVSVIPGAPTLRIGPRPPPILQ